MQAHMYIAYFIIVPDYFCEVGCQKCFNEIDIIKNSFKMEETWDFPGSPVVKILCLYCRGQVFNLWSEGTKIPHATWHSQKTNKQTNP